MHYWKKLKPLDAMEKITRQELTDHWDEILDKVDKEDIGYIILTPEGKEGEVLVPARWFDYCFDNDFGCIINSAIRYAIGRHTYMPGVVVDFIRKHINVLDTNTIKVALEDINYHLEAESTDDPIMWSKLRDELMTRQAYMLERDALEEAKLKHKYD